MPDDFSSSRAVRMICPHCRRGLSTGFTPAEWREQLRRIPRILVECPHCDRRSRLRLVTVEGSLRPDGVRDIFDREFRLVPDRHTWAVPKWGWWLLAIIGVVAAVGGWVLV